ncbi:MAG: CPBP family glutamic-type intramembrane protease [Myxococcota bacterium]
MDAAAVPVLLCALAILAGLAVARRGAFLRMHWRPDRDVAAAVGTGLLAVAFSAAILLAPEQGVAARLLHFVGIYGVCGGLLPWLWVTRVERRGASALGITRERLGLSLAIGLGAGALLFSRVVTGSDLASVDPRYFALASYSLLAGGLFELFLYYGFLHLRLERAFGPLPAVVGSAAVYSLWHVGTELPMHPEPWSALALLFAVGLLYHAFFQITHNLASIWPFFFFGGVWIDFGVNLGFPPEIARSPGWVTLSLSILLASPALLSWTRR